ncbi:MAG: RnfABCDGE type electron transport complex subunit B [Oscillospiraceae bacterium]|jgi:Na+-translocating ferredoxin:NAD+ oxidoreductase RNF subunit RnfB|nr:RnfABCDGE type electron transport complex subunit B [Oscillospiraceae bacterium]
MDIITFAVISLSIIGFACALLITVASKIMYVNVDVRVEKLRNCLPGANCGACGFSSCESYAEALAKEEAATNLCPPGGEEVLEQLNSILGVSGGEGLAKLTAVVHCTGDSETMKDKMEYSGIKTCVAAKQLYGGQGACTFGCIGFGDCVSVCPSMAICVENDLARIDPRRCSGCAVCLKVCPMGVISIEAAPLDVAVLCMNTEKGAKLKDKCSRGCIGCLKCVKECPVEAITVNDSLATIDYEKCGGCRKCVDVCIKKCLA